VGGWVLANEAATDEPAAVGYFAPLFALVRGLDPTRPVAVVTDHACAADKVSSLGLPLNAGAPIQGLDNRRFTQ
jgi:hypothetical protein